ncbi:hypothetical protein b4515 [Escherichia coli K-12]|nr:hypothetical protein b4515 [Escherichia coli K-12]
MPVRLG